LFSQALILNPCKILTQQPCSIQQQLQNKHYLRRLMDVQNCRYSNRRCPNWQQHKHHAGRPEQGQRREWREPARGLVHVEML